MTSKVTMVEVKSANPYVNGNIKNNRVSNGELSLPNPTEIVELKLESEKITLSWENIDVNLPQPGGLACCKKSIEKTHILKNVNGIAKPGQLLAIMGASGAGKTTLLNILNFRNRGDLKITGDVKLNGKPIYSTSDLTSNSGYVQQDELFLGTLTPKEHLIFQAMLRMDKVFDNKQRNMRVDQVLKELNLKKCENTRIGNPEKNIKGISGGERRRLAFATEIITNPGLLFCDEPTSGLDSYMALSVVESMKTLANEGKTIVCTIHQPSSEIFDKFDALCLLAEGRLAYIGRLPEALNHFSSIGYNIPANYNPADYYIHTLAISPFEKEKSLETVDKVCDSFQSSKYYAQLNVDIKEANLSGSNEKFDLMNKKNESTYKANFCIQLVWLLWRCARTKYRDPMATQISVVQTIFIALILGLIFLQITLNQAGIQNITGVLFLLISNNSFSTMFSVVNSFPEELPIFYREHKNGMYSVISYYIAKMLIDLPFYIILPFVSTTIIYWMVGLNSDVGVFFTCTAIMVLVANLAVAFGSFISAASPSVSAALGLAAPILVPLMIFSGIFLNNSTVPDYFIWLKYLSWFSYSYELLNINQWTGITNITCSSSYSCVSTGSQVLTNLSMKTSNWGNDWIALACLLVGWRIVTFLILLLKTYLIK